MVMFIMIFGDHPQWYYVLFLNWVITVAYRCISIVATKQAEFHWEKQKVFEQAYQELCLCHYLDKKPIVGNVEADPRQYLHEH